MIHNILIEVVALFFPPTSPKLGTANQNKNYLNIKTKNSLFGGCYG
jgi:hypothetical protein